MAPALAPMDVEERLSRLRAVMSEAGAQAPVDTLVVTNLTNIRYLTGFTGSAAVLVAAPDATSLITDGRYAEQASTQVRAAGAEVTVEIVPGPEQHRRLMALLGGTRRVGLEAESITWAQARPIWRPSWTIESAWVEPSAPRSRRSWPRDPTAPCRTHARAVDVWRSATWW
ncbi:MAG TPA: aminopeptidase P family N-terminal domain-containing protein [Microthrixaceae bacterium]|nr:aminopeptidase P family N-terminal domain-containing protein [Microthrixaceae bacterium]